MSLKLLIIDPQIDFCAPRRGALYVGGAEQDMRRLARMIERIAARLDSIHVTLDTHHFVDIAHPIFWQDEAGHHPAPFTILTASEVASGRWTTTRPSMWERALAYVQALERGGRYALCIWPPHCLIGSEGHAVQPELFAALQSWEQRFALVDYIPKGSNIYTEHYSAIQAEVPDPDDPSTQINRPLIETLLAADTVLIAGEAGSHCVANTVRDIAQQFGDDRRLSKLILLTDTISPVTGFETLQRDFLTEMSARGVKLSTSSLPRFRL
jgi:nicotinamidase/pyrazinamidase